MQNRVRYIPEGSTEIRRPGVNAVVYCHQNANGGAYAIGYAGKAFRSSFNYRFRTADARAQYINEFFTKEQAKAERRSQRLAERHSFTHSLKVGDILVYSWGYEQTNIDFFQVVEVPSSKSVRIREIGGKMESSPGFSPMSGHCVPVPDSFVGEAMLKRVTRGYKGDGWINMKHGGATLWDGKPEYCSWYA
jgi:hypothetical protein